MLARHFLELFLGRPGQGLRVMQGGAEGRELTQQHHLHPRVIVHQQLQALADAIDVSLRQDMHLDACDGERGHSKLRLGFDDWRYQTRYSGFWQPWVPAQPACCGLRYCLTTISVKYPIPGMASAGSAAVHLRSA